MKQNKTINSKIFYSKEDLIKKINALREQKSTFSFTNGCFDIIHKGHIDYLFQTSKLSDYTILGINTDESIKRLKGQSRPLQDLKSRLSVVGSLFFVDFVIPFDEDTPYELIKSIKPDFLVKGKDYKPEEIVGYDIVSKYGGKIETIELTKGYSTTNIENKIKKNIDE